MAEAAVASRSVSAGESGRNLGAVFGFSRGGSGPWRIASRPDRAIAEEAVDALDDHRLQMLHGGRDPRRHA